MNRYDLRNAFDRVTGSYCVTGHQFTRRYSAWVAVRSVLVDVGAALARIPGTYRLWRRVEDTASGTSIPIDHYARGGVVSHLRIADIESSHSCVVPRRAGTE